MLVCVARGTGKDSPKTPGGGSGTPKSGTLMKVEERERGKVDNQVYLYYAAQCGKGLVLLVLVFFIVGQVCSVLNTYLMARWSIGDTSIIIGCVVVVFSKSLAEQNLFACETSESTTLCSKRITQQTLEHY